MFTLMGEKLKFLLSIVIWPTFLGHIKLSEKTFSKEDVTNHVLQIGSVILHWLAPTNIFVIPIPLSLGLVLLRISRFCTHSILKIYFLR